MNISQSEVEDKDLFLSQEASYLLSQIGEHFGAGFCELPEAHPLLRYSRAYRRWFEKMPLSLCKEEILYPSGSIVYDSALRPSYSYTMEWDEAVFNQKCNETDDKTRTALHYLKTRFSEEYETISLPPGPHYVGGGGYTHGIVNYGRVLAEGLDGYEHRVRKCKDKVFRDGLLDLLEGIKNWHARCTAAVQNAAATSLRDPLINALKQVPFCPARSFYEAIVAYNLVFYMDGCDNPGRIDQVLWPYYRDDQNCDEQAALTLLESFFDNVCANGWSAAIGGSDETGASAYNKLTELCLHASHGRIRPSLELRVRSDMPAEIWDAAFDALATGNGQPAFYNEHEYDKALHHIGSGVKQEDFAWWCGGGCTETMIQGCSNVGSIDAGINLPLILEETLEQVLTREDSTFQDVLDAFYDDVHIKTAAVLDGLNDYFEARAKYRPQPIRTLLMDDCIDREIEFNAGGARYNWSVINVAGLANVADSLAALQEVVFQKGILTPVQMCSVLEANFEGYEPIRQQLLKCPKFGNDIPAVDDIATQLAERVYRIIRDYPCKRGCFVPSHILFEVYHHAGHCVGATPDGRIKGEPLADSMGPVQGRDQSGPTAMLNSAARLPQYLAAGTPVLNMRISMSTLQGEESKKRLQALIVSYFKQGGMQLQFTTLNKDALKDAMVHPERYGDLVVRIGGYSARFIHLSDELKQEVLKRVEHVV